MKKIYQFVLGILVILTVQPALSVNHYSCDFENESDRQRWVLTPANPSQLAQISNKWYAGTEGNNGVSGQWGLYISDDNGVSAHYANKSCFVFAYDIISLDSLTSGDYQLSFEYRAMGNMNSNSDGLYVFWIPMTNPDTGDSIPVMSIATSAGTIPSIYEDYVIQLDPLAGQDYVGGSQTWQQCVVKLKNKLCDGKPHYLAFAWMNGSSMPQQPGACLDNIEISDDRPCSAPYDINVDIQGHTCVMTWQDSTNVGRYEVSAYSYTEKRWYGPAEVVGATTYTFSGITAGEADFVVRNKCADDLMGLKAIKNCLVYYPDEMCVDYLNLKNATCYVGQMTSSDDTRTFNAFSKTKAVDFGPAQMESRHTIHFDKTEVDQRSGAMLHSVPEGELASVRLGNWDGGAQCERIEYSFLVDTLNYPVLLLKYAILLEAPGHPDKDNPRFTLDILVGGKSIGACGQADFNCNDVYVKTLKTLVPGAAEQGWHITPSSVAGTSMDIVWKEWTTVGVNLKNPAYQGKKLTIRLSTFDCTLGAHGAYAYFTISCSDGQLKGMKCGEINPVFEAPDGFSYQWSLAENEKYRDPSGIMPAQYVLGHQQKFEAGYHDDNLYAVDCMFVQDSTCYFTLYASALATNPVPVISTPQIIKNCNEGKYTLRLSGTRSWVREVDHETGESIVARTRKIDRYEWKVACGQDIRWSDKENPTFDLPKSGGDWTIDLTTYSGTCDSTVTYKLHLDSVGPTYDTTTVYLCDADRKGKGYYWEVNKQYYKDYGLDSVVLYSQMTSCDSLIYLNLLEPYRITLDTLLFDDDLPFVYHGRSYTKTITDTIPNAACDTTWILKMEVYEAVGAEIQPSLEVCADAGEINMQLTILKGRSVRYSNYIDHVPDATVENQEFKRGKGVWNVLLPLPMTIYPNIYQGKFIVHDSIPANDKTFSYQLAVLYPDSVMTIRWNDILAVRNAKYNGGFEFTGYQWYKNGQAIAGATESYYAEEGGLDQSATYCVLLTRADTKAIFSCPFDFNPSTGIRDVYGVAVPSFVTRNTTFSVEGRGTATWLNMLGAVVKKQTFTETILTPTMGGIYILHLEDERGNDQISRIIVR